MIKRFLKNLATAKWIMRIILLIIFSPIIWKLLNITYITWTTALLPLFIIVSTICSIILFALGFVMTFVIKALRK